MNHFLSAKYLSFVLCLILFAIGLWGTLSESAQLSLIPRDFSTLTDVGLVESIEGRVKQKPINDILWFPIHENETVYLGDNLETENDSNIGIEFTRFAKGKVKIGSNTFVQMKSTKNKPLILIYRGDLEVSGDTNDQIFVSSGVKIESISIKKNRVTKVKKSDKGDLEIEVQKTDLTNDQEKTEIGQSKEKWVNEDKQSAEPVVDEAIYQSPVIYPYPQNQTTFLKQKAGHIAIFPAEHCGSTRCTFQIMKNGNEPLPDTIFEQNHRIIYVVEFDATTNASYSWRFQDGPLSITGIFHIRPNNSTEMKKAVTQGYPIEIMSGL